MPRFIGKCGGGPGCKTCILGSHDSMILWYFDIVILWYYEIMIVWYYDIMIVWYYNTMTLWYNHIMINLCASGAASQRWQWLRVWQCNALTGAGHADQSKRWRPRVQNLHPKLPCPESWRKRSWKPRMQHLHPRFSCRDSWEIAAEAQAAKLAS